MLLHGAGGDRVLCTAHRSQTIYRGQGAEGRTDEGKRTPQARETPTLPDGTEALGKRLARCRKQAGLNQSELAAALGERFDHSRVSKIENGRGSMRIHTLRRAAQELRVSADFLLGLTNTPTPAAQLERQLSALRAQTKMEGTRAE